MWRGWPGVQDLLEECGQLLLVEGREAAEQDVQDDAYRPQVDRARVVAFVLEDLGRHVALVARWG